MHLSTVDDVRRGSAAVRVLSGDVASSVDLLSRSPFRLRAPDRVEKCAWERLREGTKSRPVVVRLSGWALEIPMLRGARGGA